MSAPADFDCDRFFAGVYTFQRWEMFPGHKTKGIKDVAAQLDLLGVPARLDGLRVLDIAPWNGFFGFECLRRGAAALVSFGPDDPDKTGYNKAKQILEIKNSTYVRDTVYNLSEKAHGKFDVILFLGVIYHLRHPLLALDNIFDTAASRIYVDSPVMDDRIYDITLSPEDKEAVINSLGAMNKLPLVYFSKKDETGDLYNWFIPNSRGLHDLVECAGFSIDHSVLTDGWVCLSATKSTRLFEPGIEGFNAAAAAFSND